MADPAFQRLQLGLLLALPSPVLRALSGGGVVYKGGRTLDPRLQFLASQSQGAPPLSSLTPEQARGGVAAMVQVMGGKIEPRVTVEVLTVPGAEAAIEARAYRPDDQDAAAPLMVFAHFGGGVVGNLDTCEAFCSILASVARCAVLSVGYRLAPEFRFPDGLEDMLAACRWARDTGERFGAPAGKIAVGGDSMGGNFAAVVCQEMKRLGEAQPAMQLLIYPALDVAAEVALHVGVPMVDPADDRELPREPVRRVELERVVGAVHADRAERPTVHPGFRHLDQNRLGADRLAGVHQ